MSLRCWTITKNSVESGVNAEDFSSIVPVRETDTGTVLRVRLHVVPVVDGCNGPEDDGALVYCVEDEDQQEDKGIYVVAFSPADWRPETDKTKFSVIEPRGETDKALVLIHAGQGRFLLNVSDKGLYVKAGENGPEIGRAPLAMLMLSAVTNLPGDSQGKGTCRKALCTSSSQVRRSGPRQPKRPTRPGRQQS